MDLYVGPSYPVCIFNAELLRSGKLSVGGLLENGEVARELDLIYDF